MSNGRIGPPWWLMGRGGAGESRTVSGPVAHWKDKVVAPLRSLLVNIDPVQAGTGDPSPDNVRPISGWDEAKVWRTGKNLLDLSSVRGGTFDWTTSFPSNNAATNDYIPVKGGASYVWSQKRYPPSGGRYLRWYDKDYMQIGSSVTIYSQKAYTLTAPLNACYARFLWYQPSPAWQSKDDILADEPMIELGSLATAYEPYQGNTYTIQLGQTVYGGTLDVTGGKMVVTHVSANMGELSYVKSSSADVYVFRNNIGAAPATDNIQHGLTSIYPFAGTRFISTMPDKSWMIDSAGRFTVRDDSYTDVNAFKTAMTGQTLVYELATPITIPLTPQEISTLQGQNNVWADTGDSTVEYLSGEGNPALVALALAHRIEE